MADELWQGKDFAQDETNIMQSRPFPLIDTLVHAATVGLGGPVLVRWWIAGKDGRISKLEVLRDILTEKQWE